MNCKHPIGIIDSGVGGLTVVKEVIRQLPKESIIYLGDTARYPYGPKTSEEILQYTWEMTDFLSDFNMKMLIIACNTATAVALQDIRKNLSIPVIGVVHPGARAAIKVSDRHHIGVIGTKMTINSKAYENALKSIHMDVDVKGLACPEFVTLVENGLWSGPVVEKAVAKSLEPFKNSDIDTLILGCTHYPFLQPVIESYFKEKVHVISSGEETAREASAILDHLKLLNRSAADLPTYQFFTTGEENRFREIVKIWLELENVNVQSVRLT